MHEGIDIAVPTGTPVAAAASGTVITAGWLGGYGNLVVIDHGNGLATAYGHNSGLAVGVGQSVAQGQVIAYSGSTGHSTGPHVHFEVRVNGSPVDPLGYL
jgi:murein DD-endopeptidase MepM/ murein hydrolase activator NlpD